MALVVGAVLFSGCKMTPSTSEASDAELKHTELTPEGISDFVEHRSKSQGIKDDTNYKQAFESNLADVNVSLRALKSLESADVKKAKQLLQTTMFLNFSFLPVFAEKFKMNSEQKDEYADLAKEVLNYCCEFKDELNPKLPTVQWGLRGLSQTLTDTNDLARLEQLVDALYKSSASENTN